LIAPFYVNSDDKITVSGFGTLGLVLSDSAQFGYRSDLARDTATFDGDSDFAASSVLGLQIEYSPSAQIDFVTQFVHRDQDEISLHQYVSLAFIRYSPKPGWDIRLGRTALDLFTLTEFRDVGFAYPWAAVPAEVYGIIPNRNLDGLDLSYFHQFETFSLRSKVFAGTSKTKIRTQSSLPSETVELVPVLGLSFEVDTFKWKLGAKITEVKLDDEIPSAQDLFDVLNVLPEAWWPGAAQLASDLTLKHSRALYASLSGRYDLNRWSLISELARVDSNSDAIATLNNGYASLVYHRRQHSFYTIYSYTSAEPSDLAIPLIAQQVLPELVAGVEQLANAFASSQRTVSFGWRWDLGDSLALKLQANRTTVDEGGNTLWLNKDPTGGRPKETINTLFTSLNFTF
jgi:hypothetical protein